MPQLPRDTTADLTADDIARYSRQLVLPEFGFDGQRRLAGARVLVVGAGGLGSPALLYLAAAGIGTIGIVDSDTVELSNLHRQVIHDTAAVGTEKTTSAAAAVARLNPGVTVVTHQLRLDATTVDEVVGGYDVVLDGTDNFPTRYLVNDACASAGIPLVWASVLGFSAQVAVFWPAVPGGVQLRDLFPVPPAAGTVPSCAEAGVIGAVCGQVGSIMAGEAIKLITGTGRPLLGRVLVIDALDGRWDEVPLLPSTRPAPDEQPAATCKVAPSATAAGRPEEFGDDVFLLDVREPGEFAGAHLPGSANIPLARLLAADHDPLPSGTILVVCRSGRRAEVAAASLQARGLADVRVLEGGLLGHGLL
ncbi:MAG: molybdopterin-synthase adenylyltransferase MoeB [Propionicimonas sp.]|nr:molybdopterin-synthase adenylyltransferase MoeB [Propionicimonas sp.]